MPQNAETTLRGIVLMVLSMACFAVADTFIKLAAGTMSPAQTTLFLMSGSLVIFATIAKVQGATLGDKRALAPVLLFRYVIETIGTFSMVMALTHVPLSTVGAIIQATPLLVVAGAVVFLGETVSWRRWSAIGLGFVGVLMIVQPGSAGFDLAVMWAVTAMICLSGRDLLTRLTPKDMASSSLATYAMAVAVPVALLWCGLTGQSLMPASPRWGLILGMVGFGALGYLLLLASIRMAEVSVVSPYRYSRLIFLLGFGIFLFDERPDTLMLSGAALIIASGIYTMWRDRRAKMALIAA